MRPSGARDAAITGSGAVSSLGRDREQLWHAVEEGRSGIVPITRFDTTAFGVHTGAQVVAEALATADAMAPRDAVAAERFCLAMAERALREALTQASLLGADGRASAPRVALVFGTGLAELARPLHELVAELADDCGLDGPRITISTACSSSTAAIGVGVELLALGAAEIVVAGGADVLTPEVFAGFHALGVLTPASCAPFSSPAGTTLGEGAGFLVLERPDAARARGASVLARVAGHGLSCDAWHETSPDPTGSGISRAIRAGLHDAGLAAEMVDYVNAHGSGTQSNDAAEWLGIRHALADRETVPVSSTKGALGHAQGAAGVLEAIVSLEAMHRGLVPPTLNFTVPRPHAPPDPIPGRYPRARRVEHFVSVNSAFGGANAALVLSRADAPSARGPRATRTVRLRSIIEASDADAVDPGIPSGELRRCDPSSRALTAAAARALRVGEWRVTGDRRVRTGLFVGQRRTSPESLRAFADSIAANGLTKLSASAFSRIVLNAAAGTCARLLSLRGPHTALTTGAASGLTALILGAELLAHRDDVDAMLLAGVDERDGDGDVPPAQAIVALLAAVSDATETGPCVAGWGIAGHDDLARAIAQALPNGSPPRLVELRTDPRDDGTCGAMRLVREAAERLRADPTTPILVTSAVPGTVSAALLLS